MPTAALLEPEDLIAPLDGDDPAGRPLSLAEINKLKEFQKDFDPERDLSEEERRLPQYAEEKKVSPQWQAVLDFGTKFLTGTGKDLELAVRMVEALTKHRNGGFGGAATGLKLLRRLTEDCWDRMHPALDPDDPDSLEFRVGKYTWLDDTEAKPYYPTAIRGLEVLKGRDGQSVTFTACKQEGNVPAKISPEEFKEIVAKASPSDLERVKVLDEDIAAALEELRGLYVVLDAKAGRQAPGFGAVKKALDDVQGMTREILRLRYVGEAPAEGGEGGEGGGGTEAMVASGGGGGMMPGVPIGGGNPAVVRERIYEQIEKLTAMLEDYDPHSPVTFLLRRACELRGKKFPDLVDTLTKDSNVLGFLRTPVE